MAILPINRSIKSMVLLYDSEKNAVVTTTEFCSRLPNLHEFLSKFNQRPFAHRWVILLGNWFYYCEVMGCEIKSKYFYLKLIHLWHKIRIGSEDPVCPSAQQKFLSDIWIDKMHLELYFWSTTFKPIIQKVTEMLTVWILISISFICIVV